MAIPPDDSKNLLILLDEVNKLSKTIYRDKNTLIIKSKFEDGCRVVLNRPNNATIHGMGGF